MTEQHTTSGKLSFKARIWTACCVMLSILAHVTAVQLGLFSFPAKSREAPSTEMPVDVISADDFSKLTAGNKNAPKKEAPKPIVEKVAEEKPVEDTTAKINEKKEVQASTDQPTPAPEPKPKPPEPKPAAAPEQPKTEAKAPDKKEPEQKVDPIAETLKKDDAKKPEKKAESKPQPVPPKPTPQPPKFDPRKVAALLNKDTPQRMAAPGSEVNTNAGLGYTGGAAAHLSQSEIDAFRRRVHDCWIMPPGIARDVKVVFRVLLKSDGSFSVPPVLVAGTAAAQGPAMAESAQRALLRCQPYTMFKPEHYQDWKDMEVAFKAEDFM
jgi:colicin import membrane protein